MMPLSIINIMNHASIESDGDRVLLKTRLANNNESIIYRWLNEQAHSRAIDNNIIKAIPYMLSIRY